MTRIVWELNEVVEGKGGTALMPGSHKANHAFLPEADDVDSGLWETYGCPPGSLIVFSEAVRHTGTDWTHEANGRCAILMAYNHRTVRFHEPKACALPLPPAASIDAPSGLQSAEHCASSDEATTDPSGMNPTVIRGLSEERQGFFRDVWTLGPGDPMRDALGERRV